MRHAAKPEVGPAKLLEALPVSHDQWYAISDWGFIRFLLEWRGEALRADPSGGRCAVHHARQCLDGGFRRVLVLALLSSWPISCSLNALPTTLPLPSLPTQAYQF
jgi:hypothetical protein